MYGGTDPLTGKRHELRETIPAGPSAKREAQKALSRLLHQLDERRAPRTRATVGQLMDRYLDVLDVAGAGNPVRSAQAACRYS